MRRELANLNSDDIKGAAALSEVTAMARIGGFQIGKSMTRAEIQSLKLDASRARRRGKRGRADELEKRAADREKLLTRIDTEQKFELARAPVARSDELLITGRVTDQGRPKRGIRVDLMDADGKSVAHDKSDELGSFTLRTASSDSAPARIVMSDGKGGVIRSETAPVLTRGQPAFVEFDLSGAEPQRPTQPPDDDASGQLVEVPAVTGLPSKAASGKVKAAGLVATLQERVVDGAEPGTVVKQAPTGGARVPAGSKVTLLVAASAGQKVPGLTGRLIGTAMKNLAEQELNPGNVELVHDPENAGKVLEQAPPEGSTIMRGGTISLRVATGEDKRDMQVAAILAATDARGVELGLTEQSAGRAFKRAEITEVEGLREFAKRPAAEIAERFGVAGRSRAAVVRSLIADVARRFPAS